MPGKLLVATVERPQVNYEKMIVAESGMDIRQRVVPMEMSYALALCNVGESSSLKGDGMTILRKESSKKADVLGTPRGARESIAVFFQLAGAICFTRPTLAAWNRMKQNGLSVASVADGFAIAERLVFCGIPKIISLIPEVMIRTLICAPLDYLYTKALDLRKKNPVLSAVLRGILYPFRQLAHRTANAIAYATNLITGIIGLGIDLVRSVGWLASATAGAIYSAVTGKPAKPPTFKDIITPPDGPLAAVGRELGRTLLNLVRLSPELAVVGLFIFFAPAGLALATVLGLGAAKLTAVSTAAVLAETNASQLTSLSVNTGVNRIVNRLTSSSEPKPGLDADNTNQRVATIGGDEAKIAAREARLKANKEGREQRAREIEMANVGKDINVEIEMANVGEKIDEEKGIIKETTSDQGILARLSEHKKTPSLVPREIELQPITPKVEEIELQSLPNKVEDTPTQALANPQNEQTIAPTIIDSTSTPVYPYSKDNKPPLPTMPRLQMPNRPPPQPTNNAAANIPAGGLQNTSSASSTSTKRVEKPRPPSGPRQVTSAPLSANGSNGLHQNSVFATAVSSEAKNPGPKPDPGSNPDPQSSPTNSNS